MEAALARLLESYEKDGDPILRSTPTSLVSQDAVIGLAGDLRRLLFPGYFEGGPQDGVPLEAYASSLLESAGDTLAEQVEHAFDFGGRTPLSSERAVKVAKEFLSRLPAIRALLATDVDAAFDGDPAATSKAEIVLSYPGFYATTITRLAHELYLLGVPLIPRIMGEHAHSLTGIDIHPGASIGHHFFIDHGTGVVIGETSVIGNFAKIYQGVTLGAMSTSGGQFLRGVKRHPTIADHVTIYSGASILGGATVIGEGVVIGSNAFITKSVPEKTRVSVKNPELQYKSNEPLDISSRVELEQDQFWFYTI
jgi:serine O-acetyltransferase